MQDFLLILALLYILYAQIINVRLVRNLNNVYFKKKIFSIFKKLIYIFIISFLCSNALFYSILKPKENLPDSSFKVCAFYEGSPQISKLNLENIEICNSPINKITTSKNHSFTFLDKNNEEWELTVWSGGLADPQVYRYSIVKNKIKPLWTKKGEYLSRSLSFSFGFIIAVTLLSTIEFFQKRGLKS